MGNISEFNRSKLASSVVGTPTLDQSGQILAGSITSTLNNITGSLVSLEEARLRQQIERKNALDTIDLAERSMGLAADVNDIYTQTTQNPDLSPGQRREHYRSVSKKYVTDKKAQLKSEGKDAAFTASFMRIAAGEVTQGENRLNNFVVGEQRVNALTANERMIEDARKLVSRNPDSQTFFGTLKKLEESIAVTQGFISPAELQMQLNKAGKTLTSSYLYGLMDSDPSAAIRFISEHKSEFLQEDFSPEEIQTLQNRAATALTTHYKKQNQNTILQLGFYEGELVSDFFNDKANISDVFEKIGEAEGAIVALEAHPDFNTPEMQDRYKTLQQHKERLNILLDEGIKGGQFNNEGSVSHLAELYSKYANMVDKFESGSLDGKVGALSELQQLAFTLYKTRKITNQQFNKVVGELLSAEKLGIEKMSGANQGLIREAISETGTAMRAVVNPLGELYKFATRTPYQRNVSELIKYSKSIDEDKLFDVGSDRDTAMVDLINIFTDRATSLQTTLGRELTTEELATVKQATIENHKRKLAPQFSHLRPGDTYTFPDGSQATVYSISSNGTPNFQVDNEGRFILKPEKGGN